MTYPIIGSVILYIILVVCYAINYFHDEYENTVENEGIKVGEFFGMTILVGILWPMFIIMFAIMDLRDER